MVKIWLQYSFTWVDGWKEPHLYQLFGSFKWWGNFYEVSWCLWQIIKCKSFQSNVGGSCLRFGRKEHSANYNSHCSSVCGGWEIALGEALVSFLDPLHNTLPWPSFGGRRENWLGETNCRRCKKHNKTYLNHHLVFNLMRGHIKGKVLVGLCIKLFAMSFLIL